jgi:hypothetical protein
MRRIEPSELCGIWRDARLPTGVSGVNSEPFVSQFSSATMPVLDD